MQPQSLFDAASALIVVGGTLLATVLRCGMGDVRATLKAVAALGGRHFDAAAVRAELAVQVREIQREGVIRTRPHRFGDAEFDEATDALIGTRSVLALRTAHKEHKRRRSRTSVRAVMTLNQAADLSPVFGLAGTLISLTQLPSRQDGDFTAAISMAVLTTLYGLLLGNLVFAPLGRAVARRAAQEEKERQRVLEWLEHQVADGLPTAAVSAMPRHRPTLAGHAR